jgi:hypothetical protein
MPADRDPYTLRRRNINRQPVEPSRRIADLERNSCELRGPY